MPTPRQYWNQFRNTRNQVALAMGADIARAGSVETRIVGNAGLVLLVAIVKTLVDKGVLTDADLQAAQQLVLDLTQWDQEPMNPPSSP